MTSETIAYKQFVLLYPELKTVLAGVNKGFCCKSNPYRTAIRTGLLIFRKVYLLTGTAILVLPDTGLPASTSASVNVAISML